MYPTDPKQPACPYHKHHPAFTERKGLFSILRVLNIIAMVTVKEISVFIAVISAMRKHIQAPATPE